MSVAAESEKYIARNIDTSNHKGRTFIARQWTRHPNGILIIPPILCMLVGTGYLEVDFAEEGADVAENVVDSGLDTADGDFVATFLAKRDVSSATGRAD